MTTAARLRTRTLLALCVLLAISSALADEVPGQVAFQGLLLDDEGEPVTGDVDLAFRLYDAESGGALLWSEDHDDVPVLDGVYDVALGSTASLTPDLLVGGALYLEVEVNGETLMPRQRLLAVPYALRAESAANADLARKVQLSSDLDAGDRSIRFTSTDPDRDMGMHWSLASPESTLSSIALAKGGENFWHPDNILSTRYNKSLGSRINNDEHAFDVSWEWSFKASSTCDGGTHAGLRCSPDGPKGGVSALACAMAGGVCDPTSAEKLEWNWDAVPVHYTTALSDVSGSFRVDELVLFAAGARARVVGVCDGGSEGGSICHVEEDCEGGGACAAVLGGVIKLREQSTGSSAPGVVARIGDEALPGPIVGLSSGASAVAGPVTAVSDWHRFLDFQWNLELHTATLDFIPDPARRAMLSIEPRGVAIGRDGSPVIRTLEVQNGKTSFNYEFTGSQGSNNPFVFSTRWIDEDDGTLLRSTSLMDLSAYVAPSGSDQRMGAGLNGILLKAGLDESGGPVGFDMGTVTGVSVTVDLGAGTGNLGNTFQGMIVRSPTGSHDASNVAGLVIEDQRHKGASRTDAIRIRSQNGAGASNPGRYGNLSFDGGNWDDGHLMVGGVPIVADHLWRDQGAEVWRTRTDGAPASEADGQAFVTGTGATTHGPVLWGDGSSGFDTGDAVCAASGLACRQTFAIGDATPRDCASETYGGSFLALCR